MHRLSPFLNEKVNGQPLDEVFGFAMDSPGVSTHIWKAEFPKGIEPGTHKITVRTTDMYKQIFESHRIFRVN
jgi:hypothetical protein